MKKEPFLYLLSLNYEPQYWIGISQMHHYLPIPSKKICSDVWGCRGSTDSVHPAFSGDSPLRVIIKSTDVPSVPSWVCKPVPVTSYDLLVAPMYLFIFKLSCSGEDFVQIPVEMQLSPFLLCWQRSVGSALKQWTFSRTPIYSSVSCLSPCSRSPHYRLSASIKGLTGTTTLMPHLAYAQSPQLVLLPHAPPIYLCHWLISNGSGYAPKS